MRKGRASVSASPWAVLAAAVIIYFAQADLTVMVLPILCHESGHLLILRLFGCRIQSLRLEISGLCIRYTGAPKPWQEALAALAGPAAGVLYAILARRFGPEGELSAGISLLFSAFNLIPAPPLDGARAAQVLLGEKTADALGLCFALITAAAGVICFAAGKGAALMLAGAFLLLRQAEDQSISSAILPD